MSSPKRAGARALRLADFALDPRSLAVFRVGLALVAGLDLYRRVAMRSAFYGPEGILDLATWAVVYGTAPYAWTLHGEGLAFVLLALVHAVALLCLAAGFRVRTSALVAWLLAVSLAWRNPLLSYGGEKLGALLLLALACAHRPVATSAAPAPAVAGIGGLVLRSQLVITYVVAGLAKLGEESWQSGEALGNALRLDSLVKPLGSWLADLDGLVRVATFATPAFEILVPWLLLLPAGSPRRDRLRALGVVLLLGFDLGIFLTLDVGAFMPYASVGLLGLVPAFVWESRLARRPAAALLRAGPIGGVSSESPGANASTIALATGLLTISWLSALEACRFVEIGWPRPVWNVIRAGHVYQNWDLFTDPPRIPRWYVTRALLRNGAVVDVLEHGAPVDFRRRRRPNAAFASDFRWRLAFAKSASRWREEGLRLGVARGLATAWNERRPPEERIVRMTIYRMTAPDRDEYGRRSWKVFAEWEDERGS